MFDDVDVVYIVDGVEYHGFEDEVEIEVVYAYGSLI